MADLDQSKLLKTEEVLREEAKAIHGDKAAGIENKSGPALYQALHDLNSAALCLSGGGIRSAAFALGVIQALASWPPAVCAKVEPVENAFLAKFHYLSTVSGGGYIGSWLSAWVKRAGFSAVWNDLVGRPLGSDLEPPVISWLRSYSNYLTPKLGLGSGDTWAAIALISRNFALNWFIIVPALCVALLIAKTYAFLISWFSQFSPQDCEPTHYPALAGALAVVIALSFAHIQRPAHNDSTAGPRGVLLGYLLPSVLAGMLFALGLASQCAYAIYREIPFWGAHSKVSIGVLYGLAIYLLARVITLPSWRFWRPVWQALSSRDPRVIRAAWPELAVWKDVRRDVFAAAVAGAVYGIVMAVGLFVYQRYLWDFEATHFLFFPLLDFKDAGEIFLVVLAVPWALSAQLVADMIFVGLTSHERDSDSDREWLGRASGYLAAFALTWTIVMFLVFLAAAIAFDLYKMLWTSLSGLGMGGIAAWFAKSGLTPAKGPAKDNTAWSTNAAVAAGAIVFAVVLIVATSAGLDRLLFGANLIKSAGFHARITMSGEYPAWPEGWSIWIGLAVALALALGASYFVNINRFSLHALYRNRLIRAFLGASQVTARRANPFTEFDERDNPKVSELWPARKTREETGRGWQPFHVINIALNIVSAKRLAWQERKAESFTVSPLHAGTACGNVFRGKDGVWRAPGAYRRSDVYGGPRGISLGTALAISGAAANPNMGYNSSPALAFLMTMFNMRLGWWLGHPSGAAYGGEGPTWSIAPLLNEMIGNTTDQSTFINLSDGGHFENLGLYEMVRRRCRLIVISDGGCDPDFAFEDLGNAVRKAALDLGVNITFHGLSMLRTRAQEQSTELQDSQPSAHPELYAIGTVEYGPHQEGTVLYIKAAYHPEVVRNAGVRSYAIANADFPHQSTGDQFFSESQFESYRALGFEITGDVLAFGASLLADRNHPTLEGIVAALREKAVKNPHP